MSWMLSWNPNKRVDCPYCDWYGKVKGLRRHFELVHPSVLKEEKQ